MYNKQQGYGTRIRGYGNEVETTMGIAQRAVSVVASPGYTVLDLTTGLADTKKLATL
jgi:hypothetical protein